MALDGAVLVKRGNGSSGEQPNGIAAQYQLAGTKGLASTSITPLDSGNILGTIPPGKPGLKLTNGTIQNATDLIANNQPLGNTLPSSNRPQAQGDPVMNNSQITSNGLSNNPDHE